MYDLLFPSATAPLTQEDVVDEVPEAAPNGDNNIIAAAMVTEVLNGSGDDDVEEVKEDERRKEYAHVALKLKSEARKDVESTQGMHTCNAVARLCPQAGIETI